ncbi:hypothetical protein ACHAWO_002092 [Cyclotella atomus]|uniref:Uncharacterized protein n=1 Tax=Cyclotella atomus TaxID=382360 RepID=A0ABD3Q0G8_9STRA
MAEPTAQSNNSRSGIAPPTSTRTTSLLIRIITALIAIVVANQWHLASHYVQDLHRNDARYFDVSFAAFLGEDQSHRLTTTFDLDDASYIASPICGPCFRGDTADSRQACYDVLQRLLKKSSDSLADAAQVLAERHPECELCLPQKCREHYLSCDKLAPPASDGATSANDNNNHPYKFKYWRFDRAAPKFTNPTTLTLNSIPSELRIPPSRHNTTSNSSGVDFLLEYNPGIVTLPTNLKKNLPPDAAYLISLRVTPANNCFPTHAYDNLPKYVWEAVFHTSVNHLGLALLDANYNILPGYEAVIEVESQLDLKRVVYLHVNADTTVVTKLKLRAKGYPDLIDDDTDHGSNKDSSDDEKGKLYRNYKLQNLYGGDMLQVSVEHQFNTIWSGGLFGKNYALFGVPNKTHPEAEDAVYAEIDIAPVHRVQQVILDESNHISLYNVFEHIWKPGTHKSRDFKIDNANRRMMRTIGNTTEISDLPFPSYFNVDAPWYLGSKAPFKTILHDGVITGRYSPYKSSVETMVQQGIKELLPHTHYVSLFYAFDPHPPFQIRARSGFFCLGFVPETFDNTLPASKGGRFNPHSVLTRNRMLQQNNVTFDCPQMHFVSSFTQKANDESSVVIGYGLNDCTGRLVEVTKDEVIRSLFPPLDMNMVVE